MANRYSFPGGYRSPRKPYSKFGYDSLSYLPARVGRSGALLPGPSGAAFNFTDITGVVAVWQAEDLSGAGNGGAVTGNWVDRKNGYVLAPLSGDQGTYRANAFRNGLVTGGLEQVNKAGKCVDAALLAVLAGTNKNYTIITVAQSIAFNQSYYWGLGENANFFKNLNFWYNPTQDKNAITTNFNDTDYANEYTCPAPQYHRTQKVGSSYTLFKDEISELTFTRSDTGINTQHFGVGYNSVGSSSSAISNHQISLIIIVDASALPGNVMLPADVVKTRLKIADRIGMQWKKGLTGGLWTSTKVLWECQAQSNAALEGRGLAPYIPLTAPNAYVMSCDSYLRPGNDPSGDNTNNKFPASSHSGALGSHVPTLLNALYAQGAYNGTTEAMVIGGWSLGGSTSAVWASTATPPTALNQFDISYLRMIELMRNLPSPKIYAHWIDQGEDDAVGAGTAWSGNTTTIANNIEARATTQGWLWSKTNLRHYVRALSDTQVSSPLLTVGGAVVQAAQLAWPGTRPANTALARKAGNGNMTDGNLIHFATPAWATWIPTMVADLVVAT